MVAEIDQLKTEPSFIVENGVYKGKETCYTNSYKSVGEMAWNSFLRSGNKVAQLDARTGEEVTYAELQNKVVRCAIWLQKQGIKRNDVVSVCTHNQINAFVPCLAATYLKAIFNPWDEDMDLQTALHFLQLTEPKVIFCNEKSAKVVQQALKEKGYNCKVVVFGKYCDVTSFDDVLNNCDNAKAARFRYSEDGDMKDTACIMHSSGTTGPPKGVELSNYSIMRLVEDKTLDLSQTVSLWFSSLYWISGVMMNLKVLLQNAMMIIYPEFNEEMTCKLIEKYGVTWLFLSTSMTNRFLKAGYVKSYSLPSLKLIFCGGAILKVQTQEELQRILPHVMILQAFGMTELGGVATIQKFGCKPGSCGTVIADAQIKIVDPDSGKVLGPNQTGELWIKTATIMKGYYNNAEVTKSTIDAEGWLHSGDLCYIDEDGELFIIDRIKELIKYRGHQISPGEVEAVLSTHPAVLEVAVVSVPHPTDDEHLIAYITKKPNSKVTEHDLIKHVANNMMDHFKLRAGVVFLDTFPYTGTGKIARKEIKAMAKKLATE